VTAPLHVSDRSAPDTATLRALESQGWELDEGFDLPASPWELTSRRWVRWGAVTGDSSLEAAVLAAARGVGVVAGCPDDELRDRLCDDLRRIGPLEVLRLGPDPLDSLDEDQRALLSALAGGASIADAAAELYLSTRTAERRLAAARKSLGVRTTAEAIALVT
jgi:hypothetical protein